MYALVSAIGGVALAVVATLGLVQSQESAPQPVGEPLVVYGER